MSRSIKKTPIIGHCNCCSEKKDKRIANRKFRLSTKILLKKGKDPLFSIRQISNVWQFGKDGKQYHVIYLTNDTIPDIIRLSIIKSLRK